MFNACSKQCKGCSHKFYLHTDAHVKLSESMSLSLPQDLIRQTAIHSYKLLFSQSSKI